LEKGFKIVVGLDEAGRGPLDGPVVATAVFIIANCKLKNENLKSLRNLKKLTPKNREMFFSEIVRNPFIKWV
jgi:ribonuclease HII